MYSSSDSERVNGNCNVNTSQYKSLSLYNHVAPGDIGTDPSGKRLMRRHPCPSMAVQTVPRYNVDMGFGALTHNLAPEQMAGGHYSVRNAYPAYKTHCTSFQKRSCDGYTKPSMPAHLVASYSCKSGCAAQPGVAPSAGGHGPQFATQMMCKQNCVGPVHVLPHHKKAHVVPQPPFQPGPVIPK